MADSIAPFIHRKVVVLKEDNTVYDAARAMCDRNVGSVVVADGQGHMTGMVTDRDLACGVIAANMSPDTSLADVMTKQLVWVDENAAVEDVVHLMMERGIRRVPVVHQVGNNKYQRCIGLVALDDLIAARMVSQEDLSHIVRSQVVRRQKFLPQWSGRALHNDKSAGRFLKTIQEKTGLNEQAAISFAGLVMGLLVRRLHYTGAASVISLLPKALQSELDDLPAGPDRSITGERILQEATARFDIDEGEAKRRLQGLWDALTGAMQGGTEADLADEIPDDIRILFVALPEGTGQGPRTPIPPHRPNTRA